MIKRPIIALSGPRACGKSTIASHLVNQHGYTRIAFADALRNIARIAGDEFVNDRIYLAKLGEELRQLMPHFLIEVMRIKINSLEGPIVIEDVRFPVEEAFCRELGATTIRLEIPEEEQLVRLKERDGKVGQDAADMLACLDESILDDVEWDLEIDAVGDFKILAANLNDFSNNRILTSHQIESLTSRNISSEVKA